MSDDTTDTAGFWTERETLTGEATHNGHTAELTVKDITQAEIDILERYQRAAIRAARGDLDDDDIEALPDFPWEDDGDDLNYLRSLYEEKLLAIDGRNPPPVEDVPTQKLNSLIDGMSQAWGLDIDAEEAMNEMPVEGNR